MISYFLQTTICFSLFYLLYHFLLRGDKFFDLQRIYFLSTIILSITIPIIELGGYQPVAVQQIPVVTDVLSYVQITGQTPAIGESLSWADYLMVAYFAIAGLLFLKFIFTIRTLIKVIRKGEKEVAGRYIMLYTDKQIFVASFFKYIFIQKSLKLENESLSIMLIHEKKHIHDFHFIDLIILEIIKIIFWFNPIIYLYSSSLKSVHEFICDQEVVQYTTPEHYEKLLIKSFFNQIGMPLLSQFSETSIKRRLIMIKKQKSVWIKKFKFLVVIPMAFLLIYACNNEDLPEIIESSGEISGIVADKNGKPLPGVNIVLEGTETGTVSDLTGKYTLDNSEAGAKKITFSFLGKETMTVDIKSRSVIDILLDNDNSKLRELSDFKSEKGRIIKGKIVKSDGTGMPGVFILIAGNNAGAITDIDGNYQLNVPQQYNRLLFSFTGFESQVFEIGDKSVIDVVMEEKKIASNKESYGKVQKLLFEDDSAIKGSFIAYENNKEVNLKGENKELKISDEDQFTMYSFKENKSWIVAINSGK